MNRRAFISSVLSTLLVSYQSRLSAIEQLLKPNKTGYVSDPVFLQHHISPDHPETPRRVQYIQDALQSSAIWQDLVQINLKAEIGDWLKTAHTNEHIASIRKNTPVSHKVAVAGVRACLAAVDEVASQRIDNAFCASRPPGHHALNTGKEEGFCYYNNVAIATRYVQQHYGLKKVLIIDWDYHHGNATEAMFYDDPDVLYFSTHDLYAYPGTGDPAKRGRGKGLGYNINVHLPCGTDDQSIIDIYNSILLPAANQFKPDMIFISAGFDSREHDLLGCLDITDAGFAAMTRIVMQIANTHCDGRIVSLLEGGYNLKGIASAVVAHITTLLGKS
jgi:acetoin utilization deacetylase AcuC-like enzyme